MSWVSNRRQHMKWVFKTRAVPFKISGCPSFHQGFITSVTSGFWMSGHQFYRWVQILFLFYKCACDGRKTFLHLTKVVWQDYLIFYDNQLFSWTSSWHIIPDSEPKSFSIFWAVLLFPSNSPPSVTVLSRVTGAKAKAHSSTLSINRDLIFLDPTMSDVEAWL